MSDFIELAAKSNFSFLEGASHPEELVVAAAALGSPGIAVCDRNTLAGVVRVHLAGKEVGIRTAVGCHLVFEDGTPDILAWPSDRAAYGRLCRLLTVGNMRGKKDNCRLMLSDLVEWCEGLVLAIVAHTAAPDAIAHAAGTLAARVSHPLRLTLSLSYGAQDQRRLAAHAALARRLGLRPLATTLPLYHDPARRPLQDVLTAIRLHTNVDAAGRRLAANAERHVKAPAEITRLFAAVPQAVRETLAVMDEIDFSLDELRYEYPEEPTDPGCTPQQTLERLTYDGAAKRYPDGVPQKVAALLTHELRLVESLDYAPYFLTVFDIVRFARDNAILAQGRGSAANSAVCFCLGITEVDPDRSDLLFERFISPERREPPDIDVDFEHERREEVIQYIYEKYGRDRAGIAATVITYRARSAAREVGKALGFSEDSVGAVAGSIWGWGTNGVDEAAATQAGLDPRDHRIGHLIRLSREIAGFPRHLSQHVGGFVITRGRLDEMVPVVKAAMDGRTNIEWDKDDLDALGILKIDVLALGMLTCVRKGLALLARHYGADFAALLPKRSPREASGPGAGDAPDEVDGAAGSQAVEAMGAPPSRQVPTEGFCETGAGPFLLGGPYGEAGGTHPGSETDRPVGAGADGGGGMPVRPTLTLVPCEAASGSAQGGGARGGRALRRGGYGELAASPLLTLVADASDAAPARMPRGGTSSIGSPSGRPRGVPSGAPAPGLSEPLAAEPLAGVPLDQGGAINLASIPAEDRDVYDMICRADTLGVFQIESRAQMTMLPRLRPRTFYDLVIEVAIVRPGPIQGDMVHPYLRRRQGKEQVTYPSKELEEVLSKTLGVPLFQEQAMKIAIVAAGFTPAEADQLRRAMATFKKVGTIGTFQQKMVDGMTAKGYDPAFAARCFNQIEGFGEYGFPESHAASFALLVYSSCWLKCHYPDVFCAALLNSQPMGFYAPAQIVRDARRHGVEVRPVDINLSDWDCTLEEGPRAAERLHPDHASMRGAIRSRCAVRLGLRQVKGLAEGDMHLLVARRGHGYDTVRDLWLRTGLPRVTIERLADADAFGSLGLNRRDALWGARGLDRDSRLEDLPLFAASDLARLQEEAAADLPPMPPGEEVINDYRFLSLSLKAHPAEFVRGALARERIMPARAVPGHAGRRVAVAGLVLVRQRPGSAKGVIFMTVEDETGIANVIVWPKVFEAFRTVVLGARFIKITGWVQAQDGVVHVVATKLEDRTGLLTRLTDDVGEWDALDRADEVKRPGTDPRTDTRPRTLLTRFVTEVGAMSKEAAGLGDNRTVAEALEAHRKAAATIARGGRGGGAAPDDADTGGADRDRRGDRKAPPRELPPEYRKALPKGRNFQ
ncbi:OB-fold nucleic acid binding domain-containing protein [Acuticoccus sp. I52.16.1]|uniref:helix-hairpin-helix domain-containing protein n=1 Tax=Acuticoccus sp. I52.16.1 TaxID=2928472 RepID=UPI001FD52A04|nr:OB-fold nucleic acid binding domain-containing protein [Acuticoccus sp. I52.16.1]UOM35527.1 OB-fold nucleic acid binding domain-containing protein [Acuticoccus sp. I52.16.1]